MRSVMRLGWLLENSSCPRGRLGASLLRKERRNDLAQGKPLPGLIKVSASMEPDKACPQEILLTSEKAYCCSFDLRNSTLNQKVQVPIFASSKLGPAHKTRNPSTNKHLKRDETLFVRSCERLHRRQVLLLNCELEMSFFAKKLYTQRTEQEKTGGRDAREHVCRRCNATGGVIPFLCSWASVSVVPACVARFVKESGKSSLDQASVLQCRFWMF